MEKNIITFKSNNDNLIWRSPVVEIDENTSIICPPTHEVIFIKEGMMEDIFNQGTHKPIKKAGLFKKAEKYQCEIIYVNNSREYNIFWGTPTRIDIMDPFSKMLVKYGACGKYTITVENTRRLYEKILSSNNVLTIDAIKDYFMDSLIFFVKKEISDLILENNEYEAIDFHKKKNGWLERVSYPTFESQFCGVMKPRNPEQRCAMDLIHSEVPIKLITGPFGSGKSMIMIEGMIEALQKNKFEKIIFIRNNIQVKDTDALGALPGDELAKTLPYVMPLADHCGGIEGLKTLIDTGRLEVIPLGFLRGRSIRNSILYSMESENLTKEHIQLIMGRIDEGSQLWMDGDIKQRDRSSFEKSRGLEIMIERLAGNSNFGYVKLEKSERSEVARMADLLD